MFFCIKYFYKAKLATKTMKKVINKNLKKFEAAIIDPIKFS